MKHTYLVTVEASERLEKTVVDNYVQRAVLNFHKHCDQKPFDGVPAPNIVLCFPVNDATEENTTVQQTFDLLKAVNNYFTVLKRLRGTEKK